MSKQSTRNEKLENHQEIEIEPLFLPESEDDQSIDQPIQIDLTKSEIKSTSILDEIIPIGQPSKLDSNHQTQIKSKPKLNQKHQLDLNQNHQDQFESSNRVNKKFKFLSDHSSDIEITHSNFIQTEEDSPSWKRQYLGGFMSEGFMVYSGAKLDENEQIKLIRSKLIPTKSSSKDSTDRTKIFKTSTTKPDYVVRVESQKNGHFARLNESFGQWIVPLIDFNLCEFEGNLVFPPENPRSGDTVQFYIKVYITKHAFGSPDQLTNRIKPHQSIKPSKPNPIKFYKPENPEDQLNSIKQESLIKLFEIIDLKPIQTVNPNTTSNLLKSKNSINSSQDGSISSSQLKSVFYQANLKLNQSKPILINSNKLNQSFKLKLRSYQSQGLDWLLDMETLLEETNSIHPLWDQYVFPREEGILESNQPLVPFFYNRYMGCFTLQFPHTARKSRGGILADEMGLGKTIQMAALICTARPERKESKVESLDSDKLKEEEEEKGKGKEEEEEDKEEEEEEEEKEKEEKEKEDDEEEDKIEIKKKIINLKSNQLEPVTTLVICPLTLLNQWQDELERCDPTLNVSIYHAEKSKLNDPTNGGSFDVVITTYGIVSNEWVKLDKEGMFNSNKRKKPISNGLFSVEWYRIILDEAHTIKNRNARTTKACCELKSARRWCLTGTPIVNRLDDLASLLHFVRLEPWGDFSFFKSLVTVPFSKGDQKAVEVVQVIIESTVLRREKSMKDKDGKLIIGDLPPKTIEIKSLKMNEKESKIYKMMFQNAKAKFLEVLKAGTVMKNFTMILTILIRLRQIVLHPTIVIQRVGLEFFYNLIQNLIQNEEEENSLKRLIKEFGMNQWNDEIENHEKIKKIENVLKKKKKKKKKKSDEDQEIEECSICLDFIDSRVFLPCMHSFCKECIMEYVESKMGEETMCANCNQVFVETDLIEYVGKKRKPKKMLCSSSTATSEASTQEDEEIQIDGFINEDQDKEDDKDGLGGGYLRSNHGFISSTKLEALIEDLIEVRRFEPEFSAVIFSQFTDFLNLIEKVLERDHFRFVRLDGKVSQKKRKEVLKTFNFPSDKGCILLCSLKVAGVGLNLIKANRVYMMDTWWNGAIEDQAIDRVHRFGQTKETKVTRYVMSDSIEERMIELQEKKREIVKRTFASSESDGKKSKQTLQDLEAIFAV